MSASQLEISEVMKKAVLADKACRTFQGTAKSDEDGSVLPSTLDPTVNAGLTLLTAVVIRVPFS